MTTHKPDRWDTEYSKHKQIPSSNTLFPSSALKRFVESVPELTPGKVLDLGSGNGRNSIYLAQLDWDVTGVEFSKVAVGLAEQNAVEAGVADRVRFFNQSVADRLDYPDASFDLIIDMMVMHSLSFEDRVKTLSEVKRLLRPGGYFVFHTLAAEGDEFHKLVKTNPGQELNSYTFESKGHTVVEKAFTREELVEMITPLELVTLESVESVTKAFGGEFTRVYFYGVFKG